MKLQYVLNSEVAKLFNKNYEEYKNRVLECVEESLREDKAIDMQQYFDQAQTEDDDRTWQVSIRVVEETEQLLKL